MIKSNILYLALILLLAPNAYCMFSSTISSMVSGGGRCIINDRVFAGNNVIMINGKIYIDGVLQNDSDGNNDTSSWLSWTHQLKESKTLEINENASIKVENTTGNIDVVGCDDCSQLNLSISKLGATEGELKNIAAEISQQNNAVYIKTNYLKPSVKALIHYQLQVPKNKALYFNLVNSTGDTTIQDVKGDVKAQAVSGCEKIQKIIGNAKIETSSGDVQLAEILGNAEARTVSGQAKLKKIMGIANVTTSSGDVKLDAITGNTMVKTVSGRQIINKIAASLTCTSSSGDLEIYDIAKDFNGHTVSGQVKAKEIVGNGTIETSSGDISAAVKGSFEARSVSGSVQLRKDSINAPITMKSSSGDITIFANSFNANLDAQTNNEFESDFPISLPKQKSWGAKTISTQVGTGGPSVTLANVSGDIKLISTSYK